VIGLDTNVLVRFLVEDDEAQSAQAAALVARAVEREDRLYVSDLAVCEVVWVLDRAYRVRKREIMDVLARLLRARHLAFDNRERLLQALRAFERGKGDFSDYVIREHARSAGCEKIATFDDALLGETGFTKP
jgi:predicted nucleic-acid-binding protein